MARILAQTHRSISTPSPGAPPGDSTAELTERERAILIAVARGERSKEIAHHLGVSERTVKAHLTNIYTKLNVDSRASAVAIALERGLLEKSSRHDMRAQTKLVLRVSARLTWVNQAVV